MADEIHIYSSGVVCCSVCVPKGMSREIVEKYVNIQNPTGIESQWRVSDDPKFASGHLNPSPCEQDHERLHYLLNC